MTAQPALGKADRVLGKDLLTVSAILRRKVARLLRLAAQLKIETPPWDGVSTPDRSDARPPVRETLDPDPRIL